jgi:hypothetical protein
MHFNFRLDDRGTFTYVHPPKFKETGSKEMLFSY